MAETHYMRIRGACEHNLKNIDIDIPKNKLVVLTGISGSGKSSLALDTIYADGQRRYMESLSSYARQFMGQMKRPDVENIEGLSPAISISQKSKNRNPRSTVGTVTEIYDYLRLLYARVGIPHCPNCCSEIKKQSVDQMVDQIMALPEATKIQLLAPVVKGKKGRHEKVVEQAPKSGYVRLRVDGSQYDLSEEIVLKKYVNHNIEIIVDRLAVKAGIEARLTDSIEDAFKLSDGLVMVDLINGQPLTFSQNFSCPDCGISIDEIEPRSFSFNNPCGACPECYGLGYKMEFDEELMIPDKSISIDEGAIVVIGWQFSKDKDSYTRAILEALAKEFQFSLNVPFESYSKEIHDILFYGTNRLVKVYYKGFRGEATYDLTFKGIIKSVEQRYKETTSEITKAEYESFMRIIPCKSCKGQRLKKESLVVTVADKNIFEITDMSIKDLRHFFNQMKLSDFQMIIGNEVLKEIKARISFLIEVGLDYLNLSRATETLSGGELQRIRLATQIGSGLTLEIFYKGKNIYDVLNMTVEEALKFFENFQPIRRKIEALNDVGLSYIKLGQPATTLSGGEAQRVKLAAELSRRSTGKTIYILDEPTTGLHFADVYKLNVILQRLVQGGNTVVVIEHNLDVIKTADYIIDIGPEGGDGGGTVVALGTPEEIAANPDSYTGKYIKKHL